MPTKRASYEIAEFKAATDGPKGEFTAVVSVFGNVDKQGDRVMPGAFTNSLDAFAKSGDPIPVIWSHDWKDPFANIGVVTKAAETEKGLQITGRLDIDDNPIAAQTYKLLSQRRVKEFSFGYNIPKGGESPGKDGANELNELEIFEVGPTFKGANPATELLEVKAADDMLADKIDTMITTRLHELLEEKSDAELAAMVIESKAGATHSRATRDRLAAHRQRLTDALADVDELLGTADDAAEAPKSQDADREPPAKSEDGEPEQINGDDREPPAKSDADELLALNLRIEEMRIL